MHGQCQRATATQQKQQKQSSDNSSNFAATVHAQLAACNSLLLVFISARQAATATATKTATAGNDNFNFRFRLVQLLTLNMVSISSRTPSALRHSKRSNILAKDVNRNIQKLSRRTESKRERVGDKNDRQSKVFFPEKTTTTTTQIWLFSAALQVNFLLAFALRRRHRQCQCKCPAG